MMEILFERKFDKQPEASIILLDWSCRESLHALDYLAGQSVARDRYEVVWVEFYGRRSEGISSRIRESAARGGEPAVDKWVVLGMPGEVYYHKHLMYNIGILAGTGRIIVFCDSDAIFTRTFIENILKSFDGEENLVLHMDEVRNTDKRFYPFNYPTIDEIRGKGCVNWSGDKSKGLSDREDQLHTLNYGACMCALKKDLIAIGGADEHLDFLGHICGPYEMTFRLVNAGKKEVWHGSEFIYHAWHPGTDGKDNYLGPHDGRNMSTTALEAKRTGRVFPLVENRAIRALRLGERERDLTELLRLALPEEPARWSKKGLSRKNREGGARLYEPMLLVLFLKMIRNQLSIKVNKCTRETASPLDILKKIRKGFEFLHNMARYNRYAIARCRACVERLASEGIRELAICGVNDLAEVLFRFAKGSGIIIGEIFGYGGGTAFQGLEVKPLEAAARYEGKIVVAGIAGADEKIKALRTAGVKPERIVVL